MKISKDDVKDTALATAKGAISGVPIVGGLFAELIGLAQDKIADKRMAQWMGMVEDKLQKLQDKLEALAEDELFFSSIQIATVNAMRSYQEEKRMLFANAIYNTAQLDLDSDKKLLFLSLLDRYTLTGIKLLHYYSQSHYQGESFTHKSELGITYATTGTEQPIKSILKDNPEFQNDSAYVKTLTEQLTSDGLIFPIDFNTPESPKQARRKRTTRFGDEFLSFITVDEEAL